VISRGIAGIGILEQESLIRSQTLGGDHRRNDRSSATGFPDARFEILRHAEVVPGLQRVQGFMVNRHRLVVGVIVRQIGAGQNERVAAALDHFRQRHSQSAAALIALVSHDDRNEFEISQHALQPWQLDLERMLSSSWRGRVPLTGEPHGWAHFRQLRGKRLVHRDRPQRRRVRISVENRSEIKSLEMRWGNHDHPRELSSFQRSVRVSRDRSRVLVTGVRSNHRDDRVVDRRRRRMRQQVIDHRRQHFRIGRVEAAGHSRLPHILRVGR